MNFSTEIIGHKVAVYKEVRQFHESEIARIDKLLQQLEWEGVEDDEGEVIPFANYTSFEAQNK